MVIILDSVMSDSRFYCVGLGPTVVKLAVT